jgi:hypothetical protein
MDLESFEELLSTNVVDLSQYQKAEPIKTAEEIRKEWLLQRRGKFTASEFSRLITYPNKNELPAGAKTYALEKAVELMTEIDENESFISYEMQWGIDHELEAIQALAELTGLSVKNTGTKQELIALGDDIGCTPDGLIIEEKAGIEIKCPKSKTHFNYRLIRCGAELKTEAPEYYWQVQGSMHITGFDHWYFASFDPRYKNPSHRMHYVVIDRNEDDIALLEQRLLMAIVHRNYLLKEFFR